MNMKKIATVIAIVFAVVIVILLAVLIFVNPPPRGSVSAIRKGTATSVPGAAF